MRRDAQYLDWRYLRCPDADYVLLAARRWGRLVGWSVFRRRDDRLDWGDALFDPRHARAAEPILAAALAEPELAGAARVAAWFPERPPWWSARLAELGFERRDPSRRSLGMVALADGEPEAFDDARRAVLHDGGRGSLRARRRTHRGLPAVAALSEALTSWGKRRFKLSSVKLLHREELPFTRDRPADRERPAITARRQHVSGGAGEGRTTMPEDPSVSRAERSSNLWSPEREPSRAIRYQDRLFFRLGGKLELDVDLESGKFSGVDVAEDECRRLVLWLSMRSAARCGGSCAIRALTTATSTAACRSPGVSAGSAAGTCGKQRPKSTATSQAGAESLERFGRIVREMDDGAAVEEMTLADFLGLALHARTPATPTRFRTARAPS